MLPRDTSKTIMGTSHKTRLGLGTVQFGMPYGMANRTGQVTRQEAERILTHARESGVTLLDTAISYGESEACLGAVGVQDFKVVSKLPPLPEEVSDIPVWVDEEVRGSLQRLGTDSIYGLLLHRSENLTGAGGALVFEALSQLKASKTVQKIGVSIYDPKELEPVFDRFAIDMVQAPFNLIDRRLLRSGWLDRLHQGGVEVHTRSAFLQGLLLMDRKDIPSKFDRWGSIWDDWHRQLTHHRVPATAACLQFALRHPQISHVLVGTDNLGQFQELTASAEMPLPELDLAALESDDETLINPSLWGSL